MRHLVIGKGQVGSAVIEVLSAGYEVIGLDVNDTADGKFEVVHVAFPYNDKFELALGNYLDQYLAPGGLIVIHSTVNLGVSNRFGAVHSPIRGVHPNLAEGVRTFEKFFGGARAEEAAEYFRALGVRCITTDNAENTEAMKLWDTTYYGWNIVFMRSVKAYCDQNGLDFDVVYTQANKGYNEGYAALGKTHVLRPVLKYAPGEIGGHCVVPNARIIGRSNDIAGFLLEKNDEYAKEGLPVLRGGFDSLKV